MSRLYKQVFAAAVATAALVGFMQSPAAQEAKMMHEIAQDG